MRGGTVMSTVIDGLKTAVIYGAVKVLQLIYGDEESLEASQAHTP